jgi:hypothetical protein
MNKRRAIILAAALLVMLVLVLSLTEGLVTGVLAQGMPALSIVEGPSIGWWVVAGGGGESTAAGEVAMNSTLGQPIIGPAGGDSVSLGAGYWYGAVVEYRIYLPLILRQA